MTRHFPKPELIYVLLFITLLLPLLALAYIGLFTRYMADDYCTAWAVNKLGFIHSQAFLYQGWTGRFSFSFLVGVAELWGPTLLPLLPSTALACWLTATTWAVYQLASVVPWPRPLLSSLVTTALVIFATLTTTHHIVQSLYWQSGMLTYIPPLILLTIYVGLASRALRLRKPPRAVSTQVTAAALTFIAGGFSEAYLLMQTGGLLLGALVCYKYAPAVLRRAVLPIILAGLVGSVVAACIVVAAPGNAVRQSSFPTPPGLVRLTLLSLYYASGFIAYTIYLSPLTTLLSVTLPALFGYRLREVGLGRIVKLTRAEAARRLMLLPAAGFVLMLLCTVPSVYGTSGFLPERARILPQFVVICVAVLFGYFSGIELSEWYSARKRISRRWPVVTGYTMVALLLVLSPLPAAVRTLSFVSRARQGASIWEQMDGEVRAAKRRGETDLVVPAVDDVESRLGAHRTELQLERDALNPKNQCAARYYEVNSIRAE